jgi:hypothetical protein
MKLYSVITKGKGKGIAVFTGQMTELGKIANLISSAEKDETQLQVHFLFLPNKIIKETNEKAWLDFSNHCCFVYCSRDYWSCDSWTD